MLRNRRLQQADQRKRGTAFTLVEIMIVVLIIGILLSIALPNYINARETARKKGCTENLRKIDYAKDAYMMQYNLPASTPEATFTAAGNLLYGDSNNPGYLKVKPECPGGGSYNLGDGDVLPTCNYGGGSVHTYDGSH